jgi:hypothetical protein
MCPPGAALPVCDGLPEVLRATLELALPEWVTVLVTVPLPEKMGVLEIGVSPPGTLMTPVSVAVVTAVVTTTTLVVAVTYE